MSLQSQFCVEREECYGGCSFRHIEFGRLLCVNLFLAVRLWRGIVSEWGWRSLIWSEDDAECDNQQGRDDNDGGDPCSLLQSDFAFYGSLGHLGLITPFA